MGLLIRTGEFRFIIAKEVMVISRMTIRVFWYLGMFYGVVITSTSICLFNSICYCCCFITIYLIIQQFIHHLYSDNYIFTNFVESFIRYFITICMIMKMNLTVNYLIFFYLLSANLNVHSCLVGFFLILTSIHTF
jgi:hypothetical protein